MSDSLTKTIEVSCEVQRYDPKECPESLKEPEMIMAAGELLNVSSESPCHNYCMRIVFGKGTLIQNTNGLDCQLFGKQGTSTKFTVHNKVEEKEEVEVPVDISLGNPCRTTCMDMCITPSEDIGPLLGIAFSSNSHYRGPCFLSFVLVYKDGTSKPEVFPAYKWLMKGDGILVTSQTCTVNSEVVQANPQLEMFRKQQIKHYREQYKWERSDLGPSHYKIDSILQMHFDEIFSFEKFVDYGIAAFAYTLEEWVKSVFGQYRNFQSFEDYAEILKGMDKVDEFNPDILYGGRWMQDRELGRQMLDGINPTLISKCIKMPTHFPVTDEMVKDSLNRGLSLKEEMKEGNVYIVDMVHLLKDLPGGNICPAPTGLFYVKPSGSLYPIAIQLEPNGVIFTPSDPYLDWLQAKMYFQCGNWQVHEVVHHALLTHFIAETFCVATKRNLPLAHPIYRLLNGHFVGTIFINAVARERLVSPGGLIDQHTAIGGNNAKGIQKLAKRGYKKFSLLGLALPNDLDERQVGELPNFHYREDGMLVWNAIKKMVTGIVRLFYKSDTDVAEDPELQAWVKDLHQEGFPVRKGKEKMPQVIETLDCLIAICTTIIWVCTARHCAVNTGQFQMYAFSPNAPALVRKLIPKQKSGTTVQDILDTLPTKENLFEHIRTVWILSQYMAQSFLGHHNEVLFVEKEALDVLAQFRQDLKNVEHHILERNKDLEVPYKYLLPSMIVNSISV